MLCRRLFKWYVLIVLTSKKPPPITTAASTSATAVIDAAVARKKIYNTCVIRGTYLFFCCCCVDDINDFRTRRLSVHVVVQCASPTKTTKPVHHLCRRFVADLLSPYRRTWLTRTCGVHVPESCRLRDPSASIKPLYHPSNVDEFIATVAPTSYKNYTLRSIIVE